MSAKTVYIENQSGDAKLLDDCYADLTAWGRFQIVEKPEAADVILVLSKSSSPQTLPGTTTKVWEPTANNGDGGYQNVSHAGQTVEHVYLTVAFVGKDRLTLWSETARYKWIWSHPASGVFKDLRKRMDEQATASSSGASHP